jgi:hypothetical protein
VRIVKKHFGVVRFFGADTGEEKVRFLVDFDLYFFQAEATRQYDTAFHPSAEIEPSLARRGESTLYVDRLDWTGIPLFPDRVIRPD